MPAYLNPPLETDADALADDALDTLAEAFPGFVGGDSHLETWMIQVAARMNADTRDVASAVTLGIFRAYGQTVVGLQPIDAVPAVTATTWTMQDDAGYTIPEGTQVAFRTAGDTLVPFVTADEVVVPPGDVATADGAVNIIAVDPGAAGNALGPDGLELLDPLSFVVGVVAVSATGGGNDAETDVVYLGRLIEELQLSSPTPIHADDFAVLARRIPGVVRATALDGYDPDTDTDDNERTVAVAVVDANGLALSALIKDAVEAYLDGLREVNFVVKVFDATYTAVAVDFDAIAMPGYDPELVEAAAVEAVAAYLSPANRGIEDGDETRTSWVNDDTVRYLEVASVLNDVPGLRYVTSLTLNGLEGDVVLPGHVALPLPGAITGAVT